MMENDLPDDLIRPGKAAQLLGVHISAVYRYLKKGRLTCWRLPSGHRRLSRAEVLAMPKMINRPPIGVLTFERLRRINQKAEATLRRFNLA